MIEYKNAYFVPTHRILEDENLAGFFQEAAFGSQTAKALIPFILLDDTDEHLNRDKVVSWRNEFDGIECYVINKTHIKEIYNEIAAILTAGHRGIFKAVYPDTLVNYGNTLNKMFIIGALLGCESIHRRDSDILIDTVPETGAKIYPIEVELDRLGKKIHGKTVFIVGSGYKGMKNIDFEELLGNDPALYKEYLNCLDMPEEYQAEKLRDFLNQEDPPFTDQIILNGSPECGNISFYKVFEYLPCSPAPFTLGTDYFPKEIIKQADLALVYHQRKVIHRHTKCRYDNNLKIYNYVKGVTSFVDTMSFYSDFFLNMKATILTNQSFEHDLAELNRTLVDYYREKIYHMHKHNSTRKQSFTRFMELLQKSGHSSVREAAAKLREQQDEIFQHTAALLRKHVELLEAWPFIIQAAKIARNTPALQEILQMSKLC